MQKETEYEPGDIKIEEQEVHYEPEDDLPWRNDRKSKSLPHALTKSPLSIVAIVAGVLAMIIVCLFLIIPWKSGDQKPLSPATTPSGQYENSQAELIEINQRLKTLDTKYNNIEIFKKRLDDLEQSLALRLNQMENKLADIQASFNHKKLQTAKEAAPTPQPTPPPNEVVITATPSPTPALTSKPLLTPKPENEAPTRQFTRKHYHKVNANETLFSISRRYKMRIDNLRALNKMNENDKIQLGQILIVNLPESD